jgi:glycosyltransferase involved in cell wall biosynthesis
LGRLFDDDTCQINSNFFKMKVLHLASWYPNTTGEQEGDFIQRHLKAIALFIPVHVIHVVKDQHLNTALNRSILQHGNLTETIIYYKPFRTGIGWFDKLISIRTYLNVLKQEIKSYMQANGRPDLVHVHVAMRAGLAALWMKRRFRIPFVVSEHWSGYYRADPDNYFTRDQSFRYFTRKIIRNAWWITGVSADLVKRISEIFEVSNTSVIYNVVNTHQFNYQPLARGEFRFIHISNLHPIKNVKGLFEVLASLNEIRADWKIAVVGSTDPYYHQLATRLGINERIEWKGSVSHAEVAAEIHLSNALLMFSYHENLSCVICESLCCGMPVIATRVGGTPEIVNEANGRLCDPGDKEGLLNHILELVDQYKSFDRPTIASSAASLFNEDLIGREFISLYERLPGRS